MLPFPTQSFIMDKASADETLMWLASKSQWFMYTPLPDDQVRLEVKPDAIPIVQEAASFIREN